jgi:hypothetical protein
VGPGGRLELWLRSVHVGVLVVVFGAGCWRQARVRACWHCLQPAVDRRLCRIVPDSRSRDRNPIFTLAAGCADRGGGHRNVAVPLRHPGPVQGVRLAAAQGRSARFVALSGQWRAVVLVTNRVTNVAERCRTRRPCAGGPDALRGEPDGDEPLAGSAAVGTGRYTGDAVTSYNLFMSWHP